MGVILITLPFCPSHVGTAIAYSVRDLLIQPDGGVKVVLLEGEEGGFVSVEDSREESKAEMNLDLPVQELFQPLTSLEASDRRQFQYAVLQVQCPLTLTLIHPRTRTNPL